MAKGGDQPMRNLAGQATKLSRTMHDIRYDAVNDEILVTNPFAQAIIVFKGDADGNATPIRIIQGPKTKMGGADRLDVDVVHNEIFIPDGDRVLVYPRAANGDVAPLRIIEGKDTHLRSATTLSIDPIHNLIAVGLNKTPANKAFVKAFKRKYKSNPDQFAATAYAYTYVVAQAARNGRAATPEVMQAQLAAITGTKNVKTLLGNFSFDVNRNGISPVLVQQVKGGKWGAFKTS